MRAVSLLLLTTIVYSSIKVSNATVAKYSDKTYMSVRPQTVNLPMQQTTWHTNPSKESNEKYKVTLQIIPFYQASENSSNIGKYFGFDWAGNRGKENIISVATDDATKVFRSRNIIHSNNGRNNDLVANYRMNPKQNVSGAQLDYYQELNRIVNGLYFRISTPLVKVKNKIEITTIGHEHSSALNGIAEEYSFLDYLSGKIENIIPTVGLNIANSNIQDKLKYAKIDGNTHNSSGISDIDLRLGWKMVADRKKQLSINIGLLVPTGNIANGEWLFEPVHGNGHHWAVGTSIDGSLIIRQNYKISIKINLLADYKYLLQGIEKRTLSFKDPHTDEHVKGGYYILGGEEGLAKLFPLANILTKDISVKPGSQFNGIANLSFYNKNWLFDLGYNFFYKERERVKLQNPWTNDKYAMAGINYDTTRNFLVTMANPLAATQAYASNAIAGENVAIQKSHLNLDSVKTPAIRTHKIYSELGYRCNKDKHPIILGIGGSYEFTDNNVAIEGWTVWLKSTIRF